MGLRFAQRTEDPALAIRLFASHYCFFYIRACEILPMDIKPFPPCSFSASWEVWDQELDETSHLGYLWNLIRRCS
jgi:hypothetical protein